MKSDIKLWNILHRNWLITVARFLKHQNDHDSVSKPSTFPMRFLQINQTNLWCINRIFRLLSSLHPLQVDPPHSPHLPSIGLFSFQNSPRIHASLAILGIQEACFQMQIPMRKHRVRGKCSSAKWLSLR